MMMMIIIIHRKHDWNFQY